MINSMMHDVSTAHISNKTFHYITRGVIRDGEHILLVKQKDANYTFLPGGHIELGERATEALIRELKEEIGIEVTIHSFMGAIENGWDDQFEISIVFNIEHNLCKVVTPLPASEAEAHLEFLWVHIDELESHNLLPTILIDWLQQKDSPHGLWGSTIEM